MWLELPRDGSDPARVPIGFRAREDGVSARFKSPLRRKSRLVSLPARCSDFADGDVKVAMDMD